MLNTRGPGIFAPKCTEWAASVQTCLWAAVLWFPFPLLSTYQQTLAAFSLCPAGRSVGSADTHVCTQHKQAWKCCWGACSALSSGLLLTGAQVVKGGKLRHHQQVADKPSDHEQLPLSCWELSLFKIHGSLARGCKLLCRTLFSGFSIISAWSAFYLHYLNKWMSHLYLKPTKQIIT